jgi:hypothetical protein
MSFRAVRIIKLALLTLLAILSRRAHAEGDKSGPFDLDGSSRVLAPVIFKQVAILPVVRKAATKVDSTKYLTLAEGLKSGKVKVEERGHGGEVNRVTVNNGSDRPLFLLGGQVILGGQQDRILGKDTVLAPREVATLEVYCVEHGRWSGARAFSQASGVASSKIRAKAKYDGDQGAVWAEVAKKQGSLGGANATGTYRTLATGDAGKKAAAPYRDSIVAAIDKLPEAKQMIGFVAAVNGRVTDVEVFATPELFASYRDQLLDGIFLSAADQPVSATGAALAPAPAAVTDFLKRADDAKEEDALTTRAAKTTHKKGKGVLNSEVKSDAAAAPIYKSYQSAD